MRDCTFGFVDLAGFTAAVDVHGDEAALRLAEALRDAAVAALADDARVVKLIGDAVMLAAPSPEVAVGVVARLMETLSRQPDFPLARAGLHHGAALERAGDFFGHAVNVAARVAAHAAPSQVLATAEVASAARVAGHSVVELGARTLRGVAVPVELFELEVCPQPGDALLDPVCRMAVRRGVARGLIRHEGVEYGFCSLDCIARFVAGPDRFASVAPVTVGRDDTGGSR